jgi:hypothetical protein
VTIATQPTCSKAVERIALSEKCKSITATKKSSEPQVAIKKDLNKVSDVQETQSTCQDLPEINALPLPKTEEELHIKF